MAIKQRGRVAVDQNQASGRIKQKLFCFTFISAADNNTAQLQQQQQQHTRCWPAAHSSAHKDMESSAEQTIRS